MIAPICAVHDDRTRKPENGEFGIPETVLPLMRVSA
jgi:hypothetical protein